MVELTGAPFEHAWRETRILIAGYGVMVQHVRTFTARFCSSRRSVTNGRLMAGPVVATITGLPELDKKGVGG